tara:strand:- start:919 stop:2460 length:1542 start_codon:yes stop_codon:yes gene_type:complete
MINKFIRKNNFSTTNIFTILFFTVFVIKLLNNLQTQKYFYGDDSWLLLGSRFDSIFDSLRCCAASHPIFTIFAQGIFNVLNFSTENTIVFFLIYSCLLSLLTLFLPTKILSESEKLIVLLLIISSPMFIQYGIRTKPYSTDVGISILIIMLFYRIQSSPKKRYFIILGFFLFISVSSWPLIGSVLLIYFINCLKEKNFQALSRIIYFLPGLVISAIQIFRWRDPGMQNFVVAYFAPTEGGPVLFLRWLGYSFIRYFGESNYLDLGFFELPMSISILFFLLGSLYLFKKNSDFFSFAVLGILLNLIASIFKIWPFGGFRSSIYLLPIFCIFFVKGISFITSFITNSNFKFLIISPLIVFSFINLQSPDYGQTTRYFDNEAFQNVVYEINNKEDDFLIYHGGLQTTALYSSNEISLQDIGYFERGLGTEGFHIPLFKKQNLHIACTKYLGQDDGKECLEKNLKFLENFKGNKISLVGVHIRDHQLIPYIQAFQISGWDMESINFLNEVAIIRYKK